MLSRILWVTEIMLRFRCQCRGVGGGMLPPHVRLVPAQIKMLMSTSIILTCLKLSQSQLHVPHGDLSTCSILKNAMRFGTGRRSRSTSVLIIAARVHERSTSAPLLGSQRAWTKFRGSSLTLPIPPDPPHRPFVSNPVVRGRPVNMPLRAGTRGPTSTSTGAPVALSLSALSWPRGVVKATASSLGSAFPFEIHPMSPPLFASGASEFSCRQHGAALGAVCSRLFSSTPMAGWLEV